MLTAVIKSFNTFVIVATTSNFFTFSLTGFGLTAIPISSNIACGLTISNKVMYELVMQKCNLDKKQFEKDQQTIKSFGKL